MTTEDTQCIFCTIKKTTPADKIVFENDKVIAFFDIHPVARIHILLIPKQHVASLHAVEQLPPDTVAELLRSIPHIVHIMGLESFVTKIHTGREAGQMIAHLHLHILSAEQQ